MLTQSEECAEGGVASSESLVWGWIREGFPEEVPFGLRRISRSSLGEGVE